MPPRTPRIPNCVLHSRASQTARLHLGIFLSMATILLVLVLWFIGELQKAQREQAEDEAKEGDGSKKDD